MPQRPLLGDMPESAEVVAVITEFVEGRQFFNGQVGQQAPAEVFGDGVGDGGQLLFVVVLSRGQDGVGNRRAVRSLEMDGAVHSFSAFHFVTLLANIRPAIGGIKARMAIRESTIVAFKILFRG